MTSSEFYSLRLSCLELAREIWPHSSHQQVIHVADELMNYIINGKSKDPIKSKDSSARDDLGYC
jgi:hypothetical protein